MESIGVRPLLDRIIISKIEERTTDGGIVIPNTVDNKSQRGVVIVVGPGKKKDDKEQPILLNIGDTVIFGKYAGIEITIKGKDYLVLKEDDVIAIID